MVMIAAILLASNTVGSIPLLIPFFKAIVSDPSVAERLAENPADYSSLGVDPFYGLFMMLFPFVAGMAAFALLVKEYGFFTMMPQYIVFGLIFGIVAVMDDGIESAIGAHAANNIFLVIMVTHESSALQTPALYEQTTIYPWTEFTGLVISGALFILILKVIFRWADFGQMMKRIQ